MTQNGLTYEHGARYLVKPAHWGLCESQEKKTPQFYMAFEILGQIDPQDPNGRLIESPQGERKAFWAITENAISIMLRDLADIGYDQPGFDGLVMDAPGAFDFAAKELTFTCRHEQYNGKWQERFQYGNGGGFTPLPMDQKDIAKLNAQFGSRLKKLGQGKSNDSTGRAAPSRPQRQAPQRAAAVSKSAEANYEDDGVPF